MRSSLTLKLAGVALSVLAILSFRTVLPANAITRTSQAHFGLKLNPSSVIIKVGDTATINVSLISLEDLVISNVCFSVMGFPTSGFVTAITPVCVDLSPYQTVYATLNVTATPAAAPQNVTALIVAQGDTSVAQAILSVTVVPAIPIWIPWLMILIFMVIIGVTIFFGSRRKRGSRK